MLRTQEVGTDMLKGRAHSEREKEKHKQPAARSSDDISSHGSSLRTDGGIKTDER